MASRGHSWNELFFSCRGDIFSIISRFTFLLLVSRRLNEAEQFHFERWKLEIENSFLLSSLFDFREIFFLLVYFSLHFGMTRRWRRRGRHTRRICVLLEGDRRMMLESRRLGFHCLSAAAVRRSINDEPIPMWTHVLFFGIIRATNNEKTSGDEEK